ncbi:MAG: hypothetical protein J7604_05810 [Sporocytophaga sp.]|uniref:PID-CTERM protein-sorting domain-containing protein n=1 Tax=Sporocytophaga sp. TaxID=2231183 RepID=UPI001B17D18E|nr:hypothetical protein [Sporocytophaga sp.]MBO9699707.1 hypothetical protein [Sporocytophaga sp.]
MKSIIKIVSKVIFIVLLAIAAETAYAQPGGGGGGPGGSGGPGGTGNIPMDGGIGAFLIAGAAFGAKKIHSHYKKNKELK